AWCGRPRRDAGRVWDDRERPADLLHAGPVPRPRNWPERGEPGTDAGGARAAATLPAARHAVWGGELGRADGAATGAGSESATQAKARAGKGRPVNPYKNQLSASLQAPFLFPPKAAPAAGGPAMLYPPTLPFVAGSPLGIRANAR